MGEGGGRIYVFPLSEWPRRECMCKRHFVLSFCLSSGHCARAPSSNMIGRGNLQNKELAGSWRISLPNSSSGSIKHKQLFRHTVQYLKSPTAPSPFPRTVGFRLSPALLQCALAGVKEVSSRSTLCADLLPRLRRLLCRLDRLLCRRKLSLLNFN